MTRIELDGDRLLIRSSRDEDIFSWEHRLFFVTTLGYSFDDKARLYIFSEQNELPEILRETVDYFKSEGIEFGTDDAVSVLLAELMSADKDYEEARVIGASVKASDSSISIPSSLVRVLKPYQIQAVRHLLSVRHGANFSVPGSGKTTAIYAAFELLRLDNEAEKILVIGPRSSFFPWEDEYRKCFGNPPRSARLTGPKEVRQVHYLKSEEYELLLCTYQTATNDIDELIGVCRQHKVFLVVDESHNIKKLHGGVWSEAMLKIAPHASRRAVLSGTPMPNSYADLWTQLTFLWPGKQLLGERSRYSFRVDNQSAHPSIRDDINPFFFRVRKSDLGLPPVSFNRIECELNPVQASVYHALSAKYLKELALPIEDRVSLREWRKAKMVRLIQAASNPALLTQYSEEFNIPPMSSHGASVTQLIDKYPEYEMPGKIEKAVELTRALIGEGEKVVLWTSFVHNIRMLQLLLEDFDPFIIFGAVPRDESEDEEFNREQQVRGFKSADKATVLIANPAACAESISLHKACHHAIYLDRTFNCGQFMQSMDRIHRIGLSPDEIVTYHFLIAVNTVDETIDRRLDEKKQTMEYLLDGDLEVGSFEIDVHQLSTSESEEAIDFEETISDMKSQFKVSADSPDRDR